MPDTLRIRPAAVAGTFYPADPVELRLTIERLLAEVVPTSIEPKAIIAPHAGYIYSGPIAASAYVHLLPLRERIERVVLIGPAHRVPVAGLAASSADAFLTPLGRVPVDRRSVDIVLALPQVTMSDEAHRPEHSLEVHLPFLQTVLGRFSIVPLLVGEATETMVAEVLRALWGGPETLIVISSDLSHFHDDATAKRIDAETCRLIVEQRSDQLSSGRACGFKGIAGLMTVARGDRLHVTTVDLRTSGDTAGGKDRVVGYGAWLVG
jgi:AmmeMemoRadiSam system protein B